MWENIVERDTTDDNIIWHVHIACWINKATDTHSEYVIPTAVPWQQWCCGHLSLLYMYVYCLSC